jgi:hypothetical protein
MGHFERNAHEVLLVETIETPNQTAIVLTHHTMYAHLRVDLPAITAANVDVPVGISLVKWDDGSVITGEDRTVNVLVNGIDACQATTAAGQASVVLQFADHGVYTIEVRHELTEGASVGVTVQ